jgi:peptide/nickel transport system substrate-binding protein
MRRFFWTLLVAVLATLATAQPYVTPAEYAATAKQGGEITETLFGDITTLNPYLTSSASEAAILGMVAGPGIIYRDWLGNRSFRRDDGSYNMSFAKNIEEVRRDQEWVITLREGWKWSDGTEITTADVVAARTIIGDPAVEANAFACSVVDEDPTIVEVIDTYSYRLTIPKPQVNALANQDCGLLPAHIFMPVYEASGADGIKALWGVDTPPSDIISGGPYLITEFSPGQRIVLEKNPLYGETNQAADGSPLPGPDRWIINIVADQNQVLSQVVTGQSNFYWPLTLDEVRAVKEAIDAGTIGGTLNANIGPDGLVDFITYNFNSTNECKRNMFRNAIFRQAISIMIDRNALIQAALGGLGFPAKDWNSAAAKPFDAPQLGDFEFNPEQAVDMLRSIGFTTLDDEGVLMNPSTGCRVDFDLQFNSGNNRRGQEAQVISQTAAPYGVKINAREVAVEIWQGAIVGDLDYDETGKRTTDYDAQIWGLAGGDVDNPSFDNGLRINSNLNSWNKSKADVEAWEILLDRLTVKMNETLDLNERVAIYNERAGVMREYLPMTPLISPAFHIYTNMSNVWPLEAMDSNSVESPYRPGGYRDNIAQP